MNKQLNLSKGITSIDFEEAVIKKMKNRGAKGVNYEVMDATKMSFDSSSFDNIVDKGTLDALCADRSGETAVHVLAYLNEVTRVLSAKGGVYIIISLLQDFVLDAIISYFAKGFGNEHKEGNIFELKIQKIEKIVQKTT